MAWTCVSVAASFMLMTSPCDNACVAILEANVVQAFLGFF